MQIWTSTAAYETMKRYNLYSWFVVEIPWITQAMHDFKQAFVHRNGFEFTLNEYKPIQHISFNSFWLTWFATKILDGHALTDWIVKLWMWMCFRFWQLSNRELSSVHKFRSADTAGIFRMKQNDFVFNISDWNLSFNIMVQC